MTTAAATGIAGTPDLVKCAVHEERLNRAEHRLEDQEARLRRLESVAEKLDNLSEKVTRTSRWQLWAFAAIAIAAQVLDERILPLVLKVLAP